MLMFSGVEDQVDRNFLPVNMGGNADFTFDPSKYEELW